MIKALAFVLFPALAHLLAAQTLDQPQKLPGKRPSNAAIEAWKDRKFGMFIHFGLYSELGGVWQGKQIKNGYSEQILSHAPVPASQYEALAKQFNPTKFDADAIVALAKQAGMRFIVVTSKHHDGFNLFQTKLSKYNVVDGTPFHRDVVKELSDACARGGLKFGVYYSSIDWHDSRATPYNEHNDNAIPKAHEDFNVGQLKELTSHYGPLSEIWFDMGKPTPSQSKRFAATVHETQPDCMVSGRVFNHQGDFTVMPDNHIPNFVIDEPWQAPASIYEDTWGYRSWAARSDGQDKIREHILKLAQVASRGGNYILNIGPKGDGSVVPFEAGVLQGVGAWLKENGEAIYATHPQPFRDLPFGHATVKGQRIYLLVSKKPADGRLLLPGLTNKIVRAYPLQDAQRKPLTIEEDRSGKSILASAMPKPDPVAVIVVEFKGDLSVIPPLEQPDSAGKVVLTSKAAQQFLNYNGYGYEDPPTIYKQQWAIPTATKKFRHLIIFYRKPEQNTKIDVLLGDRRIAAVSLDCPATSAPEQQECRTVLRSFPSSQHNYDLVRVTPVEPFLKGASLGVSIDRLEITDSN